MPFSVYLNMALFYLHFFFNFNLFLISFYIHPQFSPHPALPPSLLPTSIHASQWVRAPMGNQQSLAQLMPLLCGGGDIFWKLSPYKVCVLCAPPPHTHHMTPSILFSYIFRRCESHALGLHSFQNQKADEFLFIINYSTYGIPLRQYNTDSWGALSHSRRDT